MTSTPSPTSRIHGCLLGAAASEAAAFEAGAAASGAPVGNRALHLGAAGQLSFYTADALVEVLEWANAGVYADQAACVWLAYLRWADAQGIALPASAPSAPPRWIDTQPATNRQLPVRPAWAASLAGGEMGTQARPLGSAYDDGAAAARSAAFGLVSGTPLDAVTAMALDGAYLTHGHPSAVQAAAALAGIVRGLAEGGSLSDSVEAALAAHIGGRNPATDVAAALQRALARDGEHSSPAARALGAAVDAALDAAPDAAVDTAPDGAVDAAPDGAVEAALDAAPDRAVEAALDAAPDRAVDAALDAAPDGAVDAAVDRASQSSRGDAPLSGDALAGAYRAAVVRASAAGPDAAAMTGALLGTLWGAEAVPADWTGRLEGSDIAAELAATLARASGAED